VSRSPTTPPPADSEPIRIAPVLAPLDDLDDVPPTRAHIPRPRRKTLLVAGGAGVLAIVIITIALAARGGKHDAAAPAEPPAPTAVAVVEPTAPPPDPTPPPAPTPPPSQPQPAPPPPAASESPPASLPAPAPAPTPPPRPAPKRTIRKPVVLEYDDAKHQAPVPAPAANGDASVAKARVAYASGNQRLFSGDADSAVRYYHQALDTYPGYVAGYRGLGLAYAQQGDKAKALQALRMYVSLVPNAKDVPLIKKRIATLQGR
jgi:outer membrane biosynthesis protein TonB